MPEPVEIRAGLLESVERDLLGPADGPEEIVYDRRVRDRYLLGMLAPEGTVAIDPDRDDDENPDVELGDGEVGPSDDPATGLISLFPASMGVSFATLPDVASLRVVVEWGEYERVDNPMPEEERPDWQSGINRVWERNPRHHEVNVSLPVEGGPLEAHLFEPPSPAVAGAVELSGRCEIGPEGHRLVTLFLRNRLEGPERSKDRAWLFQPSLTIEADGEAAVFCGRKEAAGSTRPSSREWREDDRLDMQYRHHVEFARGHGVGVTVAVPDPVTAPGRASRLASSFLPTWEVPTTRAATPSDTPELEGLVVNMARLSDPSVSVDELQGWLRPLADGYRDWLADRTAEVSADPTLADYQVAAVDALDEAEEIARAVSAGIDLLGSDSDALDAFRFANASMCEQRLRTEAVRLMREGDERTVDEIRSELASDPHHFSWRPFQLAFLLLNLPSLADPTHADRTASTAAVDLLFFPTGGGKTEAYLGLVAATFALRRLSADMGELEGGEGVAVLMRYTLRLLTAQQFERAAALVCATEVIRRADSKHWGGVPFRLGLWVGQALTPNRSDDARKAIVDLRGKRWARSNPVQLSVCPWCGTAIDPTAADGSVYRVQTYMENTDSERTVIYCANDRCEFTFEKAPGEGVPVVTVDDEIYRVLPTFIIATIDKFAQLPWNSNGRLLFGRVSERCDRHGWRTNDPSARYPDVCTAASHHPAEGRWPTARINPVGRRLRPPDLVIQDELHLITGPLGTVAGLYETAIDQLSTWEVDGRAVRPKVIASTATIRRATDQIRRVFARSTRIFPPQVLDVRRTFFARQVEPDEAPGRIYVGVCAQGRRLKEAESRLFRTVMAAGQHQWLQHGGSADPWMTTVGFFSSIRELAGMRRIADDELKTRLQRIERERRHFLTTRFARDGTNYPDGKPRFWELNLVELTSRVGSGDLRVYLDQLGQPHVANADGNPTGTDVVLATNMISVGVDVPRLGLMVVVGQPKTTAEYIQASSRVGRSEDGPGLVFTLHNWARPRDMSHWETFEHYHATFYRHVEAQSVTPFADRALDRALTAVLVALVRGEVDDWAPDRAPNTIDVHDSRWDGIGGVVADRARFTDGSKTAVDLVGRMIRDRIDDLQRRQRTASAPLAWRAVGKDSERDNLVALLQSAEAGGEWTLWTLPNSMRNIEPGINLLLRGPKTLAPPPAPKPMFTPPELQAPKSEPRAIDTIEDEDAEEALRRDAEPEAEFGEDES